MNEFLFTATARAISTFLKTSSFMCVGFLFFCCAFTAQTATGQTLSVDEIAPPPLKILSKEEKKQLDETIDLKKRTNLALALMEVRLKQAESLDAQNQFTQMYEELGAFHALMDYTLNFLRRGNDGRRGILNNFKRFEMGLRTFPSRIEIIRRELPIKYESYLRALLVIIRDTRSKAVETFFSDSVVPEPNNRP